MPVACVYNALLSLQDAGPGVALQETPFHVGFHLEQAPERDREGEFVGEALTFKELTGRNVGEADEAARVLRLCLLVG